ncbi:MAG TPA: hypothetical protein VI731_06605 [Bacteroidia bacterium]|nr:hypothetical protein [Bacteroidia bacterium]
MRFIFSICCILFLGSAFTPQANNYPFREWKQEELEQANTAKNVSYMTSEEKQVFFYLNLARINPKLFAETYYQQYLDSSGIKNSYTTSLLATLKKSKFSHALLPDSLLWSAAAGHAAATGKQGTTGHAGHEKRYKLVKKRFPYWAECCSYGAAKSFGIAIQLLIDEGVPDHSHRESLLDPKYTHAGASIQTHNKYAWTCVINLGGATE